MTRQTVIMIGVATTVAVAVSAGIAMATIPGAGGTIQGCYQKNNGQLRVVDTSVDCRASEVAISWNEKGQKGDAGAPGADGAPGIQGPQGIPGVAGTNGVDGKDGQPGQDGQPGAKGNPGAPGPKGDKGDTGPSLSGYEIVGASVDVPTFQTKDAQVTCPAGKVVIGGGFNSAHLNPLISAPGSGIEADGIFFFYPGNGGWVGRAYNGGRLGVLSDDFSVYAICVTP